MSDEEEDGPMLWTCSPFRPCPQVRHDAWSQSLLSSCKSASLTWFFGPENRIQRKTQDNNGKLCLVCVLPDSRILHTGASSKARPCTSSVISIPWRFASGFPQQTPFELLQIEMVQGWVTLFERCSKHWLGRNQERRKTKLHLQDGI